LRGCYVSWLHQDWSGTSFGQIWFRLNITYHVKNQPGQRVVLTVRRDYPNNRTIVKLCTRVAVLARLRLWCPRWQSSCPVGDVEFCWVSSKWRVTMACGTWLREPWYPQQLLAEFVDRQDSYTGTA
jgi:hypothetical protein